MDCIWALLHEQLISEHPSKTDQEISGDSTNNSVYANGPGAKCLPERHYDQDGETGYFERCVTSPMAERGFEFNDKIRSELEYCERNDQIHQNRFANGRDRP